MSDTVALVLEVLGGLFGVALVAFGLTYVCMCRFLKDTSGD